jgi:hypothetical protein
MSVAAKPERAPALILEIPADARVPALRSYTFTNKAERDVTTP